MTTDPTAAHPPSRRPQRRRRGPIGGSPGTLTVDPAAVPPLLRVIAYDRDGVVDERSPSLQRIAELRRPGRIVWLDISGLGDLDLMRSIAAAFGLHRLALEDVVSAQQRAKTEDYAEHGFLVLRMIDHGQQHSTEQLSLCLGDDFVVTFQERHGDCFDAVRQRLGDAAGRMRNSGPDYLAYALLDAVVDAYFPALEAIGDELEACEESIVGARDATVVQRLHEVRRRMLVVRRALWPLREATSALARGDAGRFQQPTRVYLRDVHDHVVQLLDLLENYRELGTSLMELHLATTSHRLNEVMKVLTVIATIFIPLTFVTGIYGMNFERMPGKDWEHGFDLLLGLMTAIALGMLAWFRRRGWI